MSDAGPSPTKSGWSDAEKVALLIEIAAQKGGPDWKSLKLPKGRTQKACMHVWQKMKAEASTVATESNEGSTTPTAKEKAAKAANKRKANGADGQKDGIKKAKKNIKAEDADDEELAKVKGEPTDEGIRVA